MSSKRHLVIFHVSFWIFNFLFTSFLWDSPYNYSQMLMAIPFYINYFGLIPLFLHKNKPLHLTIWFLCVWIVMIGTFAAFHLIYDYTWGLDYYQGEAGMNVPKMVSVGAYVSFYYIALSTGSRLLVDWLKNNKIEHQLLLQKTETQLQLVKSNINIPFILETLTSIEKTAILSPQDAQNPVISLSNVLRYGLYDTLAAHVSLSKEITILEDYFVLINQNQSYFSLHLQADRDIERQKVPPNILVKFISNWQEAFSEELIGPQQISITTNQNSVYISLPIGFTTEQFLESINEKFILPKHRLFQIDYIIEKNQIQLAIRNL